MAVISPPDARVVTDTLTGIGTDPLPGGELLAAVAYPDYFTLVDGDPVDTLQVDFLGLYGMSQTDVDDWIRTTGYLFTAQGFQVIAYAIWERVEDLVTIPSDICVLGVCASVPLQWCLPFTDLCLPVAGQSVPGGVTHRVWLLLKELPPQGPFLPQLSPFLLLLAPILLPFILSGAAAIGLLLGVIQVITGHAVFTAPQVPSIPWPDIAPLPPAGNPGNAGQSGQNQVPPKVPPQPKQLPTKPGTPAGPTFEQGLTTGLLIGGVALTVAGVGVLIVSGGVE